MGAAQAASNTGLQALMSEGFRLGPAPVPIGEPLLRTKSPDTLIERLIRHCTVNGYTSWPAVAVAMEAALRELHTEARLRYADDAHAWIKAGGIEFAVQFCEDGEPGDLPYVAAVYLRNAWRDPDEVLAPKLVSELREAGSKWRPE